MSEVDVDINVIYSTESNILHMENKMLLEFCKCSESYSVVWYVELALLPGQVYISNWLEYQVQCAAICVCSRRLVTGSTL